MTLGRLGKYHLEGLLHHLAYKAMAVYGPIYAAAVAAWYAGLVPLKPFMALLWAISTPIVVEFLKGIASVVSMGSLFTKFVERKVRKLRETYRGRYLAALALFLVGIIVWIMALAVIVVL